MPENVVQKGISFPFRFGPRGGVTVSDTAGPSYPHLRESLLQLALTAPGERRMEPLFGVGLNSQLFEPNASELALMEFKFQEQVDIWDRRIELPRCKAFQPDETTLVVEAAFKPVNTEGTDIMVTEILRREV